jgi:hypothetical protein
MRSEWQGGGLGDDSRAPVSQVSGQKKVLHQHEHSAKDSREKNRE